MVRSAIIAVIALAGGFILGLGVAASQAYFQADVALPSGDTRVQLRIAGLPIRSYPMPPHMFRYIPYPPDSPALPWRGERQWFALYRFNGISRRSPHMVGHQILDCLEQIARHAVEIDVAEASALKQGFLRRAIEEGPHAAILWCGPEEAAMRAAHSRQNGANRKGAAR